MSLLEQISECSVLFPDTSEDDMRELVAASEQSVRDLQEQVNRERARHGNDIRRHRQKETELALERTVYMASVLGLLAKYHRAGIKKKLFSYRDPVSVHSEGVLPHIQCRIESLKEMVESIIEHGSPNQFDVANVSTQMGFIQGVLWTQGQYSLHDIYFHDSLLRRPE